MGPRAALIALCALACGCGAENTHGGGGGQDMAAATADMGMACSTVVDVTATSDYAPARLTATAQVFGVSQPTWTVTLAGDSTVYTPTPLDPSNLRVQLDAMKAGTYTFSVYFASGACSGQGVKTLLNPTGATMKYRLRALPPETLGLPLKDTPLVLVGGVPLSSFDLTLSAGTAIAGTLTGPGGATAGEVRLIADSGPDAVTTTTSGPFTLAVLGDGLYTPLLIPSSVALAPHLGAQAQGLDFAGAPFVVGAGATVGGTVSDVASSPLAGVHVVLRAGALPSGPGTSDATGNFTLHAEPGSYTLSFGSDGWPEGTLAGVTVPAGGLTIGVQYTVTRAPVAATVVASDGTTPVAGARVTLTSRPLGTVANVSIGGNVQAAAGRVMRVVASAADGTLPGLALPDGTYDVVVEPPAQSPDGLTALTVTVAGGATWALRLQPPIALAGRVTGAGGQPVIGARVTAFELAGLGAAPSTLTDNDGHYALTVGAGAPVSLLVEPSALDKLSSRRVALAAGTTQADVALDPGLLVSGQVLSPAGAPLRAVRVEALCWSCSSPTPLADAVSDDAGGYRIYLPDPGNVVVVDGGAGD